MGYLVIYEKTDTGLSAYIPDLPGCVATGVDKDEVFQNLKEEGLPVPLPSTQSDLLEVA